MLPRMPVTEIKDLCPNESIYNIIVEDVNNVDKLKVGELKSIISRYNEYFTWKAGDGNYQNLQGNKASLVQKVQSMLEAGTFYEPPQETGNFLAWDSERKRKHYAIIMEQRKDDVIECPFCAFEYTRDYLVTHVPDCAKEYSNFMLEKNFTQDLQSTLLDLSSPPKLTQNDTNLQSEKTDFTRPSFSFGTNLLSSTEDQGKKISERTNFTWPSFSFGTSPESPIEDQGKKFKVILVGNGGVGKSVCFFK